jgi:hypothetical protein
MKTLARASLSPSNCQETRTAMATSQAAARWALDSPARPLAHQIATASNAVIA